MIEVKNLNRLFDKKQALYDINVRLEDGETNLIIRQNGPGKIVLVKGIVGLLLPDSGQVLYDDHDFVAVRKREQVMTHREVGMMFQNSTLFGSLSVLEDVMFPLDIFSTKNYRERVKCAQECLECVNLLDAQDKAPGELPGDMQERVAIARAIVLNPRYLFHDEPNSGLGPETPLIIDQSLSGIIKEFGIITIIDTHDMSSVMEIGEHITFIYQGHAEWAGNRDNVANSDDKKLNGLVSASDLFKKVKQAENEE